MGLLEVRDGAELVVEVGCGPGIQLASLLASKGADTTKFIGIEPAGNLRMSARKRVEDFPNAAIIDGRFEELPLDERSVDYLYSILAFHWTSDVDRSVAEMVRVLKPDGEMDLVFIGKDTGKEFLRKTSPIYFRNLSPRQLMDMASIRQRLTSKICNTAFGGKFGDRILAVTESSTTYYDTLDGHWSWWCRIEGQFDHLPPETRQELDREAKEALASLETEQGIPYTVHLFHVRLRRS